MIELRITKYDPRNRNGLGHYMLDEWTEFDDVGEKVSIEDYERVEEAYCSAAERLLVTAGNPDLVVRTLQNSQGKSPYIEGQSIKVTELKETVRALLRGEYWCRLEAADVFVHIGWDFYMYIGVPQLDP